MSDIDQLLKAAFKKNHLTASEKMYQQFAHYLDLLQTWNAVFNLTSITDLHAQIDLHLIDSLLVLPFLQGKTALDIGSGAGFPGLPLAIMNPDINWVLLDKNGKKTRFLTQVVAELELTHVTVIQSSAEDFHTEHCFDSIVSRAFGTLSLFLDVTQHLLCPAGTWIAMKGQYPEAELKAIPDCFSVLQTVPLEIQGVDAKRHIVCLQRKSGS